MKLKNSPGALAALSRALGHLAKARLELKQADHELSEVRGLSYRTLMRGELFKFLDQLSEALRNKSEAPLGLRLVSETPEEGSMPSGLFDFVESVDAKGHVAVVVTQTDGKPLVQFLQADKVFTDYREYLKARAKAARENGED